MWNMKFKIFFFILVSFVFVGCNKPNPHPELLDPVYMDIKKDLDDQEKVVAEALSALKEKKTDLQVAKPQTGQLKWAQKRLSEADDRYTKAVQRLEFLKIKLESRYNYSRKSYIVAFRKKSSWPDPKEQEEYFQTKKLRQSPKFWSYKDRKRQFDQANKPKPADSAHEEGGHH